jgi:hypothetical protein
MPLSPGPTRRTGAASVPTANDWALNDPVAVRVEPGGLPPSFNQCFRTPSISASIMTSLSNGHA